MPPPDTDPYVVNTAAERRTVRGARSAAGGNSDTNCAICTTVTVINWVKPQRLTTARLAELLGVPDSDAGLGDSVAAQARKIAEAVFSQTGRHKMILGDPDRLASHDQASKWMLGLPDDTAFAVYVEGPGNWGGMVRYHWLNAFKVGSRLSYFDYQSDRSLPEWIPAGPARAGGPIVGVVTQNDIQSEYGKASLAGFNLDSPDATQAADDNAKIQARARSPELRSDDQLGAFKTDQAGLMVIAFPPTHF